MQIARCRFDLYSSHAMPDSIHFGFLSGFFPSPTHCIALYPTRILSQKVITLLMTCMVYLCPTVCALSPSPLVLPSSLKMFAYAAQEHCARHGTRVEHFAKISSKNRRHGAQNPRAAIQVGGSAARYCIGMHAFQAGLVRSGYRYEGMNASCVY